MRHHAPSSRRAQMTTRQRMTTVSLLTSRGRASSSSHGLSPPGPPGMAGEQSRAWKERPPCRGSGIEYTIPTPQQPRFVCPTWHLMEDLARDERRERPEQPISELKLGRMILLRTRMIQVPTPSKFEFQKRRGLHSDQLDGQPGPFLAALVHEPKCRTSRSVSRKSWRPPRQTIRERACPAWVGPRRNDAGIVQMKGDYGVLGKNTDAS